MTAQWQVIADLKQERHDQDEQWGIQQHTHEIWKMIEGEESGEVSKAILELREAQKKLKYMQSRYPVGHEDLQKQELLVMEKRNHLKIELTQQAAVIVAWLEDFSDYER